MKKTSKPMDLPYQNQDSRFLKRAGKYIFALSLLIAVLILINGGYAIQQMWKIKAEFFNVSNRDLPLANKLLPLLDRQFEQTILLEKLNGAKKKHRKITVRVLEDHFLRIGEKFRKSIDSLEVFIDEFAAASNERTRAEMIRVADALRRIDREHAGYQSHVIKLGGQILKGKKGIKKRFRFVFKEEKELREVVTELRDEVQMFTRRSAWEVERLEQITIYGMIFFSLLMFLIGVVILYLINKLIQSRDEAMETISYHASHDSLTGMLNRNAFFEVLEESILKARHESLPLSLSVCDLDFFKKINDTYGHQAGDEVLASFSEIVRERIGPGATAGRFGGDEFVILFSELPVQEAASILESIRSEIHNRIFRAGGQTFQASATFGVAGLQGRSLDAELLLERADQALYTAKERGRNTVVQEG